MPDYSRSLMNMPVEIDANFILHVKFFSSLPKNSQIHLVLANAI